MMTMILMMTVVPMAMMTIGEDDDDNENDVGDFVSQRTKSPYLMRVGRARFVLLLAPPAQVKHKTASIHAPRSS